MGKVPWRVQTKWITSVIPVTLKAEIGRKSSRLSWAK
jgi:hypothetical protein